MTVVESLQPPTVRLHSTSVSSITLSLTRPPCHTDSCGHIASYTLYYCLRDLDDGQCLGMLTTSWYLLLVIDVVVDLVIANIANHLHFCCQFCAARRSRLTDFIVASSDSILTWLMVCHSQWNIGQRPLVPAQLFFAVARLFPAILEILYPHFLLRAPFPGVLWLPSTFVDVW